MVMGDTIDTYFTAFSNDFCLAGDCMNASTSSIFAFGAPENWWLFLLGCLLLVIVFLNGFFVHRLLRQQGFLFGGGRFLKNYSRSRSTLKIILFACGLLAIAVAFLHPRWGKKEEMVQQEGRDLFILLDISRSMLSQDFSPNRLEFAKQKIKTLLSVLPSDRLGLVVFAGKPIIHCPLTQDRSAFTLFLDQIDSAIVGEGTTSLDKALDIVLEQFNRVPGHKNKLAILVTDGEDFSQNLAEIRKKATDQGLRIFTLGIGSAQGAPIPEYNEQGIKTGFVKDASGAVVISRLNESLLKGLSQQVGGLYVSAATDDSDVHLIKAQVEQFEKEKFDQRRMSTLQEQYPWFVGISFICLALEWIL
jgi:Ca-activated chloride channel family protein